MNQYCTASNTITFIMKLQNLNLVEPDRHFKEWLKAHGYNEIGQKFKLPPNSKIK